MIRIQVTYENEKFVSLIAKGHAESADYGHDTVCAAVSAIIQGGINALKDDEKNYSLSIEKGDLELKRLTSKMSEHDEIVIETIYVQLESVAQVAKDYVQLERKQK